MTRIETFTQTARATACYADRYVFLVLPGFSTLELGSAVEAFTAANSVSPSCGLSWKLVSETGEHVLSEAGLSVSVAGPLPDLGRRDCVVIFGGRVSPPLLSPQIKAWMRRSARSGTAFCGVGGGVLTLAEAGLAEGRSIGTHWEQEPVLSERYPSIDPRCSVYEIDHNILSCGGGSTTLDMFLFLIAQRSGRDVAEAVADKLLHANTRDAQDRQTRSDLSRLGTRCSKLARALSIIRERVETPLTPSAVAQEIGISTRQLERLFSKYIGKSPKSYITRLRLDRARLLLRQSDMKVIEVAIACGFESPSHFSRLYRSQFGLSPIMDGAAGQESPSLGRSSL